MFQCNAVLYDPVADETRRFESQTNLQKSFVQQRESICMKDCQMEKSAVELSMVLICCIWNRMDENVKDFVPD